MKRVLSVAMAIVLCMGVSLPDASALAEIAGTAKTQAAQGSSAGSLQPGDVSADDLADDPYADGGSGGLGQDAAAAGGDLAAGDLAAGGLAGGYPAADGLAGGDPAVDGLAGGYPAVDGLVAVDGADAGESDAAGAAGDGNAADSYADVPAATSDIDGDSVTPGAIGFNDSSGDGADDPTSSSIPAGQGDASAADGSSTGNAAGAPGSQGASGTSNSNFGYNPGTSDGALDAGEDVQGEAVPETRVLLATVKAAAGKRYTVAVEADAEANLPEDAKLSAARIMVTPEGYDPEDRAWRNRPTESEKFVTAKQLAARAGKLREAIEVQPGDIVFYTEFISLAIVSEATGEEVQPEVPVRVTVQSNVVSDKVSDKLAAAFYDDVPEGADRAQALQLEDLSGDDPKDKKYKHGVKLAFEAERLSELGLAGVVTPEPEEAQPATEQAAGEAQSANDPSAEQTTGDAQPAAEPSSEQAAGEAQAADEPATEQTTAEAQPAAEQATGDAQPAAEPAAEQAAGEAQPAAEPAAEQATAETQPAAEQAAGEAQPAAEPAVEQAAGEAQAADETAAEQATAAAQPAGEPAAESAADEPAAESAAKLASSAAEPAAEDAAGPAEGDYSGTVPKALSETREVETFYSACTGDTYKVTVIYDAQAGIPGDARLEVHELSARQSEAYIEQGAQALDCPRDSVVSARAFDISFVDTKTGERIQPTEGVKVYITLDEGLHVADAVSVVHFASSDPASATGKSTADAADAAATGKSAAEAAATGAPEVISSDVRGKTLQFEAESFSVFAVMQISKERRLTASDGSSYLITVTYDDESGIPASAELEALEIKPGDAGYDEYVQLTAAKVGREVKQLDYAHAFDIALVDPATGNRYQPTKDVKVSIRLLGEDVREGDLMSVVHFPGSEAGAPPAGEAASAQVMESAISGDAVEFETNGFSVYVIEKDKLIKHFVFLNGNDPASDVFSEQALIDGEKLVEAPSPTRDGAVFSHWSGTDGGEVFDFANGPYKRVSIVDSEIAGDTQEQKQAWLDANPVYFYAVYDTEMTVVTFYNQSGLVVQKVSVSKPGSLDTTDDEYRYTPIQDKENTYVDFAYWTTNKNASQGSDPAGTLQITTESPANIDLYPVLEEGHYLNFDANRASVGNASIVFTPPLFVTTRDHTGTYDQKAKAVADEIVADLAETDNKGIPETEGYVFQGWFANAQGTDSAIFTPKDDESGLNYDLEEFKTLLDSNAHLPNNPVLYARWAPKDTANYTVIIWKQKITDDKDAADADKTYDFEESHPMTGTPGDPVSADSTHLNKEYTGFHLNNVNTQENVTLKADGTTVVNVYYDRDLITFTFARRTFVKVNNPSTSRHYYTADGYAIVYNKNAPNPGWYYITSADPRIVDSRTVIYTWDGNDVTRATNYNFDTQYYAKMHYEGDTQNYQWIPLQKVYRYSTDNNNCYDKRDEIERFTGLYGQPLSYCGYSWPGERWLDPNNDSMRWTFVVTPVAEFKYDLNAVSVGDTTETIQVQHYFQKVNGDEPDFDGAPDSYAENSKDLYTYSNNFDTLYTGMKPTKYKIGDGEWTNITNQVVQIVLSANTKVYFERDIEHLDFFDPLSNTSMRFTDPGTGQTTDYKPVRYGAPLSELASITPPDTSYNDGYEFTGWYYDEEAKAPVDFENDTMPAANKRIYAGWEVKKYPITLIPDGGELGGSTGTPNTYSTFFNVEHGGRIAQYKDVNRDYVKVAPGTGTHAYEVTYDEDGTRSALYTENPADESLTLDYVSVPGAYVLLGWYEAVLDGDGNVQKDRYGQYVTQSKPFNFDRPPNRPVTLVAKWQRAGGFYVRYNIEDPNLAGVEGISYEGIQIPTDHNEYIESAHAQVQPALGSPRGYALDYWTDSMGNAYKPNELVPIQEALSQQSDSLMIITLTAHYRPYMPSERTMADYTFKTNISATYDDNGALQSVDFDPQGYKTYEIQTISINEELKPPITPPAPLGYEFKGWYYDSQGTRRFDGFGLITYPTYTTIYAVFAKVHTVTYYLTNASNGQKTDTVLATQSYSAVGTPEKLDTRHIIHPVDPDHYVQGWTTNGYDQYDYNRVTSQDVVSDLVLYAKLKERNYVEFDSQGGSYVDTQEIPDGGWPVRPTPPTRTGYNFLGWYTSATGGAEYRFNKVLTDVSGFDGRKLYARWQPVGTIPDNLTVVWWAQTADRPDDDAQAKADTSHYQFIYKETFSAPLGNYSFADDGYSFMNSLDTSATADWWKDIVKVAQRAGSDPVTSQFVSLNGGNTADLAKFYDFDPSSWPFSIDAELVVDDSGHSVLNVRFVLKTYTLIFNTRETGNSTNPAVIRIVNKTRRETPYTSNGEYRFAVWLNKDISNDFPWPRTANDNYAYTERVSGRAFTQWSADKGSGFGTMPQAADSTMILNAANNNSTPNGITYTPDGASKSYSGTARYMVWDESKSAPDKYSPMLDSFGNPKTESISYGDPQNGANYSSSPHSGSSIVGVRVKEIDGYSIVTKGIPGIDIATVYHNPTRTNGSSDYNVPYAVKKNNSNDVYYYYKINSYNLSLELGDLADFEPIDGFPKTLDYKSALGPNLGEASNAAVEQTPEGYTFRGWSTAPNQVSESAAISDSMTMPAHNLTLYAIWEPVTYTVTTVGVDREGNANAGAESATYTASYGQKLKELGIKNPKADGEIFSGWVLEETEAPITGNYVIKGNIRVKPVWQDLRLRFVEYDENVPGGVVGHGEAPEDGNSYMVGARVVIKDGNGMYVDRYDVNGHYYKGTFAFWNTQPDGSGQSYYPDNTFIFYEDTVDEYGEPLEYLTLYAIYSEYRETILYYDKNASDAEFIKDDGSGDPYTSQYLKDGTVQVLFRDIMNPGPPAVSDPNRKRPNDVFRLGEDEAGDKFTVTRTETLKDSNGNPRYGGDGELLTNTYLFGGWATTSDAYLPMAQNGDRAYVNTINDDTENTLYALWAICKIQTDERDKYDNVIHVERMFPTIQSAVNFVNSEPVDARGNLLFPQKSAAVEMLIDYKMDSSNSVSIPAGTSITLTTATTGKLRYKGNTASSRTATVYKYYQGNSMFVTNGDLTFNNITVDGDSSQIHTLGIVTVKGAGNLTLDNGATLENTHVEVGGSEAVSGGAIRFESTGTVTMKNGSRIQNCWARDGGAVFVTGGGDLVMESGAVISGCRCYCWGGAVQVRNGTMSMQDGARIQDCIAGMPYEGGTVDGRGGAIYVHKDNGGGSLDLAEGAVIKNCEATMFGGGIFADIRSSRSFSFAGTVDGCKAATDGGGIYMASAPTYTETTEPEEGSDAEPVSVKRKCVSMTGGVVKDCWAKAGNGGGLYLANGEIDMSGLAITSNRAAASGGGVYSKATVSLADVTVSQCYAVTSGGGICQVSNGSLTMTGSSSVEGCHAVRGGGIYAERDVKLLAAGAVVKDCTAQGVSISSEGVASLVGEPSASAENLGGGVYQKNATFELRNASGATIQGCSAYHGGGIYADGKVMLGKNGDTSVYGVVSGCNAVDGAGIYHKSKDLIIYAGNSSITGNTSTGYGGGIYYASDYVSNAGRLTIHGGSVTSNKAAHGAGVYVVDGTSSSKRVFNLYGGSITGNEASATGGGIAVGGPDTEIWLRNAIVVQNNTMGTGDDEVDCNVYLNHDSNGIIHTDSTALKAEAYIGVYVEDGDDLFGKHGSSGMHFGTYNKTDNLNRFRNDRMPFLYGVKGESNMIDWVSFTCKVTDGDGNLLYKDDNPNHESPAVFVHLGYQNSDNAQYLESHAFNRVNHGTLYNSDGTRYGGSEFKIEMLVGSYTTTSSANNWIMATVAGKTVTLTTASKTARDGFPYTGADGTYSTIKHGTGYNNSSLFTVNGNLALTNITLDGGAVIDEDGNLTGGFKITQAGGLVALMGSGTLRISDGATLQNSYNAGNGDNEGGGAVSNRSQNAGTVNNSVTMDGGSIVHCVTEGYGGAVALSRGSFTMTGGTISNCFARKGVSNTSGIGGAVHVYSKDTNNPTTVSMSGGEIKDCKAIAGGAGVHVEAGARMNISGSPVFSDNVVSTAGFGGKTNGGSPYEPVDAQAEEPEYFLVHRDIFLGGTGNPLGSLVVTGKLTAAANSEAAMPEGSIWVWADNENHYKVDRQFAVVADAYNPTTSDLEDMLKAFRNAQDDDATENPNPDLYLYGMPGEGKNIIWGAEPTDAKKVVLKKVSENHEPLAGAVFSVYKGNSEQPYKVKHAGADDEVLENLPASTATGVFWIGWLPYSSSTVYYLHETVVPEGYVGHVPEGSGAGSGAGGSGAGSGAGGRWFYLLVDGTGATASSGYADRTAARTAYEAWLAQQA